LLPLRDDITPSLWIDHLGGSQVVVRVRPLSEKEVTDGLAAECCQALSAHNAVSWRTKLSQGNVTCARITA
jgi:hypothetical protein